MPPSDWSCTLLQTADVGMNVGVNMAQICQPLETISGFRQIATDCYREIEAIEHNLKNCFNR